MKISKILVGAIAAVAMVGFFGCKSNNDDPNEMIKKESSKLYKIDYTNDSSEVSRGYKSTSTKHSGGLFVIEMNNQEATSTNADGVMGVIFDLKNGSDKTKKDFYVVGVNYGYGNEGKGKLGYYASKYKNVEDLQASNFGATKIYDPSKTADLTAFNETTDTAELVLSTAFKYVTLTPDTDKSVKVVINVEMKDGAYTVTLYTADALNDKGTAIKDGATALATETIPATITGYTKEEQNQLAFYANVYAKRTLTGSWKLPNAQNYIQVEE